MDETVSKRQKREIMNIIVCSFLWLVIKVKEQVRGRRDFVERGGARWSSWFLQKRMLYCDAK
jgi:hypothetical protein